MWLRWLQSLGLLHKQIKTQQTAKQKVTQDIIMRSILKKKNKNLLQSVKAPDLKVYVIAAPKP